MGNDKWTNQELGLLKENYPETTKIQIIQIIPQRTLNSIHIKASDLNIKNKYKWSTKQIDILRKGYQEVGFKVAKKIGRTKIAISSKAQELGIKFIGQKIELSDDEEQILIGSMFGDGHMQKRGNSILYHEKHGIKQEQYLLWKKRLLDSKFKNKLSYTKDREAVYFTTNSSMTTFNDIYNNFYPYKKDYAGIKYKIFSIDMLNKLKPLGLAIWYMDDGNYNKANRTVNIATNQNCVDVIKGWAKEKLNMNCGIFKDKRSNGAVVYFCVRDSKKFIELIKPHVPKCMNYKIEITKDERERHLKHNREVYKKWRDNNREKYRVSQRIRSKRFYKKHKEEIKKQQKLSRSKPEFKEKEKQYLKEYYKRPEVIEHRRKYFNNPKWKAHKKEYDKKRRENAKKS